LVVNNRINFQASMQMPGLVHNSPLIFLCLQYSPVLLGIEPPPLGTQIDYVKSGDWSLSELQMVTAKNASRFLLIRGLIRIIIVDQWLPFLLEQLTYRGLINIGSCVKWTPPLCSKLRRSVVVGPTDLKSAVLFSQLKNGFELRRKHSTNPRDVVEFSAFENVHFSALFVESQFTLQTRIAFLNHCLGNHIIDPFNNDVMLLAHQLGLESIVELPATIFNQRGERLVVVVDDMFNRVRRTTYKFFLHLMSKMTFETDLLSLMTVQDMFDSLECKMLSQLPEQGTFQNDSQLCEYFLACIEERLIERLLLYGDENTSTPISLCNISPVLLQSLLSSSDPFYPQTLHLLSDKYGPLRFAGINAHKVFVDRLIPSTSKDNRVCSIVFQHIGPRGGLHVLRQNEKGLQPVASTIVTLPASAIKIIFCDDPVEEALLSHHSGVESNFLQIYLPHHFRIPIGKAKHYSRGGTEKPLCMSVTLIYPSPWWRPLLSRAMEPESLFMEGYGVDLDEFPEDFKPPSLFAFIPEDRSLRGFCHNFRDLSYDQPETVGIIQTQIFSKSVETHWSTDDEVLAQLVHTHLVKSLKASKNGYQRYIASSVNRLSPLAISNDTRDPPYLEARSINPELTKVDKAVYFRNAGKPNVGGTKFDFFITEDWWALLSDGAGIHVLSELTRSCEPAKIPEEEALARDALSWEVMTGLKWAKFCLTADSHPTWSENRAIVSLKAAAIDARSTFSSESSNVYIRNADNGDDHIVENENRTEIQVASALKRSHSASLRRSSRLVKRPCTMNL
uniref:Guanylate cyclase n=1 Tax=Hydatigena taeniaeformis TaxID=6205 RepID=A0A0R3WIT5_HYDTA